MKFLLITVLFFSANISALTQYEFVQRLKSTHPFFKQQALIGQIRQIEKQASSANEDWILAANSDLQNDNSTRTNTIKFSARKKIVSLGSELIFAKTLSKKNQNSERRNQFSVDYSHPLLRNSNGVNDRLDGDIAQISIDKNRLQRAEAEEDFILQNLQRLVNLAYAQERQRINAQRLTLAGQELDLVRQKFNASVVDKVDVLSQQDAYQSAEQQLFLAQQDLLSLQSEVAIILNIEPDFAIAEIDIYKTKKLPDANKNQFKNARILAITQLNEQNFKRQLLSFNNQNLLQLDLNLGISKENKENNNTKFANSEPQKPRWNVGLELSYPLGNTAADSNISNAEIQLQRLEQQKYEQKLQLQTKSATLRVQIDLLAKTLASNSKQIAIAKARTVEEKKRYSNGNGQASFVINAQNNEQNVQLNYAQVAKNYQNAYLEYQAAADVLYP